MRWLFLLAILLVASASTVSAKETVSAGYYLSGDTLSIEDSSYVVLISSNSDSVMFRENSSSGFFLDEGQCFIKNEYEACLDSFEIAKNNQNSAKITIYLFEPVLNISTTIEKNNSFLGETNSVSVLIKGDSENDIANLNVEFFIPDTIEVIGNTCKEKDVPQGTVIYIKKDTLKKGQSASCEVELTSYSSYKHTFTPTYNYSFLQESFKGNMDSIYLEFKDHISVSSDLGTVNETEPFEFNISIANEVDDEININSLRIYLPKDISIQKIPNKLTKNQDEKIESSLLQVYNDELTLDQNENETYTFTLQTNKDGTFSAFVLLAYEIDNVAYQSALERFDFSINISESKNTLNTQTLCGGNDFNLTTSIDLSNTSIFAGNTISSIIYAQSMVDENITWANIAIMNNNELQSKSTKPFTRLQKYNLLTINEKVPYTYNASTYDFDVQIDYFCNTSKKELSFNTTIPFPITTFSDLTLVKNIEKTEMFSGETIKVNVSIENPSKDEFYGLRVREVIPSELKTQGVTARNFYVQQEKTSQAYTYFVTAPKVNETTTYTIKTIMDVPVENDTLSFEQEHILTIKPNYNISLKIKETPETGRLYVNEPTTIQYEIENNDTKTARNVIFAINQTAEFDTNKYEERIGQIAPGEKYSFEISLIPKKTNISNKAILTYQDANGKPKEIIQTNNYTFTSSRITPPYIEYRIDVIENETQNVFMYIISNPSNSERQFTYFNGNETITKNISSNEDQEITLTFDELPKRLNQSTGLVSYSFFDTNYYTAPTERTYLYIEPIVEPEFNQSRNSNNNSTTQNLIELEEPEKGILTVVLFSLFFGSILLGGVIGTFVYLHRRDHKPSISQEDIDKAEKTTVSETHVMDKVDSPKEKGKGKKPIDETPIEKKKLEPTNIFSYDDYEELKKQLDEKDSKHKKFKK